jgi:hypothetical protein
VNIYNNEVVKRHYRKASGTSPFGARKLPQGKVFSGKYLPVVNIHNNEVVINIYL